MKIIINASTIKMGGALKVAVDFIKFTLDVDHHFYYIISKEIYLEIDFGLPQEYHQVLQYSPASLSKHFRVKKEIQKIEKKYNPDIIYSIGAPSYVKFKVTEVLRLTNGLMFSKSKIHLKEYTNKEYIKLKLINYVKRKFINRNHYIITQTQIARKEISEVFQVPISRINVIPNTIVLDEIDLIPKEINKKCFSILAIGTPYLHKNFPIITKVIQNLQERGVNNFKFFITMPEDFNNSVLTKILNEVKNDGFEDKIYNFGKVKLSQISRVYNQVDVVFCPSLLEVFSSTYLEAMAFEKPILVADLPFSREVCGNAALYYDPLDASMAADRLLELMNDFKKRKGIINEGKNKLKQFSNVKSIYYKHINFLEEIYKNEQS